MSWLTRHRDTLTLIRNGLIDAADLRDKYNELYRHRTIPRAELSAALADHLLALRLGLPWPTEFVDRAALLDLIADRLLDALLIACRDADGVPVLYTQHDMPADRHAERLVWLSSLTDDMLSDHAVWLARRHFPPINQSDS